jgi:phage shock protein E
MKKLMFFALLVVLGSCKKEQETTELEDTVVIEVLSPEVFENHLQEENVQLIDVRTPKEFESGHLKGAKNHHIYDKDFREQVSYLDKEKPVYVYCKAGGRSHEAAEELKTMGFKKVYDLQGGISEWKGELE